MYTWMETVINIQTNYFNFSNVDDKTEVHSAVCKSMYTYTNGWALYVFDLI